MSQFVEQDARDALAAGLAELRLTPDAETLDRLLAYATELVHWGRRVNLTGAAAAVDLIRGPLFDALTLLPVLDDGSSLVDVGAGGGLPGIPAKILKPDLRLTLVEPRSRRTSFLRHALHALRLEGEVVQCRERELRDHQWGGAVAQAVWPAPEWLRRGPRLVVPGGAIYCLTVDPIDPRDLPADAVVELERSFTRPHDDAPRIATLVRLP
ncbi:MAG: class I SAM-dependent methyltransferase [Deltaproteobacteria bacterium]|nr:class I SAM-dependent methyltransferase [Deltaproteobacteria bacterium]